MSLRLALAIVGATTVGLGGIAAKSGALEEYGVTPSWFDPAQFQTTMHSFGGASSDQPASVTGSKGAKVVVVSPPNDNPTPPAPATAQQSLRDQLFEAMGFHTGPDPREGDGLDALRMRQKDAMGELGVKDIGIDAMMKDIQTEMQNMKF